MAKFTSRFEGYPEDLVRAVGMSMNGLIRRICEENEAKGGRASFLRPETATPEWLMNNIVEQIAIGLFQRPSEKRSINELALKVIERYRGEIEEWIEENKVNLAEIGFLFDPNDPDNTAFPPVQNFAPRPTAAGQVPPAAPQAGIRAIICRRGRK